MNQPVNRNMTSLAEPATVDPRVDEILVQARMAFVEKGFDGASMQDLARAAGMSAGNFYRYFPSKAAIVEAMVTRDLDEVELDFAAIANSPDPMQALRATLRRRLEGGCKDDHPLWAEIVAAAARKPEIAMVLGQMEAAIHRLIVRVFALVGGTDEAAADARFGAHARMVLLLVRGAALENANQSKPQSDLTALILRTIDCLVDEVVQSAPRSLK